MSGENPPDENALDGGPEAGPPPHRLDPEPGATRHRLDPDLAAAAARGVARTEPEPADPAEARPARRPAHPAIDTRPYRWMIGIFGLVLVLLISVYQFVAHGVGTVGVPAGKRLHYFAAPLATSSLNGDANLNPPCAPAKHDPRALNVCILASSAPVVLAFFVTGSKDCKRSVDTLQTVAAQFPAAKFAAVAVRANHSDAAAAVRAHRWTIPVAYDRDGAVGVFYGVETCPMLELAYRGGIVADRLIGDHWLAPGTLAGRVRAMLAHAG